MRRLVGMWCRKRKACMQCLGLHPPLFQLGKRCTLKTLESRCMIPGMAGKVSKSRSLAFSPTAMNHGSPKASPQPFSF